MGEIARIALRKPVIGYGGKEMTTLVIAEPSAGLWWKLGDPYRTVWEVGEDGARRYERTIDRKVMREYVAKLGGFDDPLHLDQLSFADTDKAVAAVFGWFVGQNGEDDAAPSESAGGPAGNRTTP